MSEAVVDSSVLAAILFGEPEMEQALALIRGYQLLAPDLLPYEIANIAVTKTRRGPNSVDEVVARLAEFAELGV